METTNTADATRWLDPRERQLWLRTHAALMLIPDAVEFQLQRDANMSLFEYYALAMLSEAPERCAQMSQLAMLTNGSLSRLSHAVKRLEKRGWVERRTAAHDKRVNVAYLTDAGFSALQEAAPAHVNHVREVIFDPLTTAQQQALHEALGALINALDPNLLSGVDPAALANPDPGCPPVTAGDG